MSTQPESSNRAAATSQSKATSSGVQLTELLIKYGEMTAEMAALKERINELINSGVQPEPIPDKQHESESLIIPPIQAPPEEAFNPTHPPHYPSHPHHIYNLNTNPSRPYPSPSSSPFQTSQQSSRQNRPHPFHKPKMSLTSEAISRTRTRTFTNLEIPLDRLYEQLKAADKIGVLPPLLYRHGKPARYNPQAVCAYHSGSIGHATVDCWLLKHKIQDMIEAGEIVIKKREAPGPNMNNPLPEPTNTVGLILDDMGYEEQIQKLANEAEVLRVSSCPDHAEFSHIPEGSISQSDD